ncbi:MAG: flagellar basal body protein [Rubrivivax sp.]
MLNRMTAQIDFQAQALALRSERQRLLASNIANADTPGYQARDMDFAAALRSATRRLDSSPMARGAPSSAARALSASGGGGELGDPIAASGAGTVESAAAAGALRWATPAQTNLDRNTVDMDRERASFADNALRYEATLRFVNGQLRTLQEAMRNHNGA